MIHCMGESTEEYVAKRLAQGAVVFGFGSYATMKLGHSACPKSLLGMLGLLQLIWQWQTDVLTGKQMWFAIN